MRTVVRPSFGADHRRMSILGSVHKAVGLAVVVVVGLYVVLNVSAVLAGFGRSFVVAHHIGAMLERIVPSAIEAQDELADTAGREPDGRWIEQRCEFGSDDSGWIAINHRETCVMRSVTAWGVDSEHEARRLLPLREMRRGSGDGCLALGPVGDIGVVESPEATYVDSAAAGSDLWCTRVIDDPEGAHELVGDREPIGDGRWLVVVAEQPLVDLDIGCVRWTVVLCGNPWLRHAWADWSPPGS